MAHDALGTENAAAHQHADVPRGCKQHHGTHAKVHLTVAGISHLTLLVPAILLLFITFVIAILSYFPFGPFTWERFLVWIEFAYLIRFQLIGALLLAVVLPASYFLFPTIFIGLFDALGFRSFVFVVAASLQLAWTVIITSRLVLVYGPDRFPSIRTL